MLAALALAASLAIPPAPTSHVTDSTGSLSAGATERVADELQQYEESTGHQVIVWIGQTTGDVPLEDWTIRAAEQWKIGRQGKDDGAILFVFMHDRTVRIEVGYGLESTLTDASASEIIRNTIVPKMRAGDVDGAIQSGVDQMLVTITPSFASRLGRTFAPVQQTPEITTRHMFEVILVLICLVVLLTFVVPLILPRAGNAWYWGAGAGSSFGGGGGFFGGSVCGGGFSGGGGGFGGGGASGGW